MQESFPQKKTRLLVDLRTLALRHNRDYYASMIPIVERMEIEEEDILDTYIAALDTDRGKLFASRGAFVTVEKVETIIT